MQRLDLAAIDRLRSAAVNFIRTLAGQIGTIAQYSARSRPGRKTGPAQTQKKRPGVDVIRMKPKMTALL